jgi:ApbE superfamily uncharacterized protein (UPF0280 family)
MRTRPSVRSRKGDTRAARSEVVDAMSKEVRAVAKQLAATGEEALLSCIDACTAVAERYADADAVGDLRCNQTATADAVEAPSVTHDQASSGELKHAVIWCAPPRMADMVSLAVQD